MRKLQIAQCLALGTTIFPVRKAAKEKKSGE